MSSPPLQHERRATQRFDFHLPATIKFGDAKEESGFTQDISARGAFFYLQSPVEVGSSVELTLNMPSEITLATAMRVRCRGRVLRAVRPMTGTKFGIAVFLEGYEFLPDTNADRISEAGDFERISCLHASSIVT